MLTREENERLIHVGPGTPAGEWLRRYWHPFALSDRWEGIKTLWQCEEPVTFNGQAGTAASHGARLATFGGQPTPIRLLGEDLVLYPDGAGRPGLIQTRCPHRSASFEYGRVRPEGIECCYHGWYFDRGGRGGGGRARAHGGHSRALAALSGSGAARRGGAHSSAWQHAVRDGPQLVRATPWPGRRHRRGRHGLRNAAPSPRDAVGN
jgi:hypothetical protein